MRFNVYRRIDDALVAVPVGTPLPRALRGPGAMRLIGRAEVPLAHLSDGLVEDIARLGYAAAEGADAALLRARAGFAAGVADARARRADPHPA